MCGIFCAFANCSQGVTEALSSTFQTVQRNINRRGPNGTKIEICDIANKLFFFGTSVLWLQGEKITKQPIHNSKSIFIYNGDNFDSNNKYDRKKIGDTKLMLEYLESNDLCFEDLKLHEGPYALCYLDKTRSRLLFARDSYGRRSLLIGKGKGQIILTSVAKRNTDFEFHELPAIGLFCFDLITDKLSLYAWHESLHCENKVKELELFLSVDITVHAKSTTTSKSFIKPNETDLNITHLASSIEGECLFKSILNNEELQSNVVTLERLLKAAMEKRLSNLPRYCRNCIISKSECNHCLVSILFSGGVDCSILAVLADEFEDPSRPIDLINVAFCKNNEGFNTPDRQTGLLTVEELKKVCPNRNWNLVEVNIPEEELNFERRHRIADLIYPLKSILDDSLGCALWFAGRGKSDTYESPSRVTLVGMGADELFGGYTRHRAAFKQGGWQELHKVLNEDWEKLPYRNLARDDRVVSDHGRQLRTPYLDEAVVKFVQGLNCWQKTYPAEPLPQGLGEKYLLRALAYHLGLKQAASFKKRALQFGSRIANAKENAHDDSLRLLGADVVST